MQKYNKAILAGASALVTIGVAVGMISQEDGLTLTNALATAVPALLTAVAVFAGPANKQ